MSKKDRLSGRLEPRRSRAAAPSEEVRSRGAEEMQEATIESLRLCQQARSVRELMQLLRGYFQRLTGCEAVGVRLRDGDDFPYYETRGFPPEFVRAENRLRAVDQAGEVVRDSSGNPVLECMCGNILCGRYDPSKPFFTAHGSFWSNCTTELLAGATETDRQARTRNRCNGEGYESVALLPLRGGSDRRPECSCCPADGRCRQQPRRRADQHGR